MTPHTAGSLPLRNIWLNQLRHRRTGADGIEFDSDGIVPNEQADAAQDPDSVYVSRIEREQCKLRSSNFLWSSVKSSSCANTKSFNIKRLPPFSIVHLVQSCRDLRVRPTQGVAYVGIDFSAIAREKSRSDQRERGMRSEHTPSLITSPARKATEGASYLLGGNILSRAVSNQRGSRCGQHTFGVFPMALPRQVGR